MIPRPSNCRRVRIACSACARTKLRCDGQRPCSRCVHLQIVESCQDRLKSAGCRRSRRLRTAACGACSYAKVACSTERPCPRCSRLGFGLECVASSLQLSGRVPRVWARQMAPLSLTLPFPEFVRDFFLNMRKSLTQPEALDLALSPESLDMLCGALQWAVPVDQLGNLRSQFDTFQIASDYEICDSDSVDIMIEYVQEMRPMPPGTPEFSYYRTGSGNAVSMNRPALSLLGYSEKDLEEAAMSGVHPIHKNYNFLPVIYNFFHPDSWLILSNVILHIYVSFLLASCQTIPFQMPLPVQKFDCQLSRCDGRPLPVHMVVSISPRAARATFSFTIAQPTAVPASLAILAHDKTLI